MHQFSISPKNPKMLRRTFISNLNNLPILDRGFDFFLLYLNSLFYIQRRGFEKSTVDFDPHMKTVKVKNSTWCFQVEIFSMLKDIIVRSNNLVLSLKVSIKCFALIEEGFIRLFYHVLASNSDQSKKSKCATNIGLPRQRKIIFRRK